MSEVIDLRGRRKGQVAPTSFTAKLLTLAVGETIYVPDEVADKGPTVQERALGSAMSRAPAIEGRRFTSTRMVAVKTGPAEMHTILAITRTE